MFHPKSTLNSKLLGSAAVFTLFSIVSPTYAQYSFTAIDVPWADPGNTDPYGINNAGQISGTYYDGSYHGFLYSHGTYTPLNVPGAVATYATDINDKGQIVGYYSDASGTHGFLYSDGRYTTLNGPSAFATYAYGINNRDQIVGVYSASSNQPFFLHGGSYSPLNPPYSDAVPTGITNTSQVVGFGIGGSEGGDIGWVDTGGTYTPIEVPSALNTVAWGINSKGEIVGGFNCGNLKCGTSNFIEQGYLYRDGIYTIINDPLAAINTEAFGVNDKGQIVGWYDNGYGFLASPSVPEPSTWAMMLLGFAGLGFVTYRRQQKAHLQPD
jgi:probable HAF family extracellular repeat protein